MTETNGIVAPQSVVELQVKPDKQRITVDVNGAVVEIETVRVTRYMCDLALEKAVFAYRKETGDVNGFSPSVFKLEMAKQLVKWWNLPVHVTNGGWEALSIEASEKVGNAIGITDALERLKGISGKEVQKAKN